MPDDNIKNLAMEWCVSDSPNNVSENYYCADCDEFGARIDNLSAGLKSDAKMKDDDIYMIAAMAGEIGNNSFDHNIGNWPDMPGIFFGWSIDGNAARIVMADRGRGKPDRKFQIIKRR